MILQAKRPVNAQQDTILETCVGPAQRRTASLSQYTNGINQNGKQYPLFAKSGSFAPCSFCMMNHKDGSNNDTYILAFCLPPNYIGQRKTNNTATVSDPRIPIQLGGTCHQSTPHSCVTFHCLSPAVKCLTTVLVDSCTQSRFESVLDHRRTSKLVVTVILLDKALYTRQHRELQTPKAVTARPARLGSPPAR